jgi:3'-phosphoadenosine 5'-phosphosulfate sulfotransferase (PAPS reductase)/FAD synthetase
VTINHIGVSGGKDSTALLLWAVHESGYPRESLNVTFCDTGNESPITLDYVAMLSEKVWPITVLKPLRGFYDLAKWKKRFPSAKARFCTEHLKIIPTKEHVTALLKAGNEVLLHSGVRAAESEARANLPVRAFDGTFRAWVFRPLLSWTIDEVWAIHARYGVVRNPLYDAGCSRVGCFPCIMSRKAEIAMIARNFPERIEFLAAQENDPGFPKGSTFYKRDMTPEQFRTVEVTCKDGRIVKVPNIRDVADWAKTEWGGKQYSLPLHDDFDEDDYRACPSSLGQCE